MVAWLAGELLAATKAAKLAYGTAYHTCRVSKRFATIFAANSAPIGPHLRFSPAPTIPILVYQTDRRRQRQPGAAGYLKGNYTFQKAPSVSGRLGKGSPWCSSTSGFTIKGDTTTRCKTHCIVNSTTKDNA